jgi:hypothetical protein
MFARLTIAFTALFAFCACASDGDDGGDASGGSGGKGSAGTGSGTAGKPTSFGGGPVRNGPMSAGAECPSDIGFPDAYALPNVKGTVEGGNVRISFDPQGDALDYRVYVLPKAGDVSGSTANGAIYRCAGNSAVTRPAIDDATTPQNPGVRTRADSAVKGFMRKAADATLGYVFTTPGDDRLPVYALGASDVKADNVMCYVMRWPESRVKKYTTSEDERTELLAQAWRDDGIAFYVPKPGAAGTEPIYYGLEGSSDLQNPLYMKGGAEHEQRSGSGMELSEAFSVYGEAQEGSEPLMRVYYDHTCARGHDELVAGQARFFRAYQQGPQPVTELHWSGLSEETTLVVEALDAQCPFQGILAPTSRPARTDPHQGFSIDYPAFQTPEELAAGSPSGEVFVNGQGDGTAPKAIARTCLKVKPAPVEAEWSYDGSPEAYSAPEMKGFQIWETESPTFNVQFHTVATDQHSIGALFGELWATYADWAADTNGKLRITPKQRATLADDAFVHATMEVDAVSSERRYPQLLIGDAEWPVQENLVNASTVIIQTFGGVTIALDVQIEFCDHRTWDVNNQCPKYDVYTVNSGDKSFLAPRLEINGYMGVDRTIRFDAYVSTGRVYLYTNGVPYGCADLPAGKMKAGPGTVTFGDSLYHSGVDLEEWYPFHRSKLQTQTSRHYSNLAFTSGVAAPPWDESIMPCAAASSLK